MVPLDSPERELARDTTRLGPRGLSQGRKRSLALAWPATSEARRAESSGGGAGSCTRVRKNIPAGIYDAYPPLMCRTRREEAEKPPGTNPEKSRRPRPRQPVTASLLK
jgi:hypothetical protein